MVLLFKGIAPPSQSPANIASGAPTKPNYACFQGRVDVCSETHGRSRGGGGCLHHAHCTFPKKKLSLYTTCPQCVHARQLQEHVVCPSWGAPPWGPKTWVMEVVEMREMKKGGLIALVQGTIKVVVVIARHFACRTFSFLVSLHSLCLLLASRWTSTAVSDNGRP